MKVVLTIEGDQIVIHDPDTTYDQRTLTQWIDQATRALGGNGEMHLVTDTELADQPEGDDDADEPDDIGFRGRTA